MPGPPPVAMTLSRVPLVDASARRRAGRRWRRRRGPARTRSGAGPARSPGCGRCRTRRWWSARPRSAGSPRPWRIPAGTARRAWNRPAGNPGPAPPAGRTAKPDWPQFEGLLSSIGWAPCDPAMHKAHFRSGVNSPSGRSAAPEVRRAGCRPARPGWELRSDVRRNADRFSRARNARRAGIGMNRLRRRVGHVGCDGGWRADSETVYRTWAGSFLLDAVHGIVMRN